MRRLVAATVVVVLVAAAGVAVAQPGPPTRTSPPAPEKSWLGVGIQNGYSGVLVSEVIPGTPARDAGLLAGDQIIAVAGKRMTSSNALSTDIAARAVGEQVMLQVLRRGKRLKLPVVLDTLPSPSEVLQLRLGARPAPAFSLPVVTGSSGVLRTYRGRVVVLLFWSTWDTASKTVMHPLSKLALDIGPHRLQVIGVSPDAPAVQRKYLASNKLPFTMLYDARGSVRTRSYRTSAVPAIVVVDRRGIVRYAGIGSGPNVDHAVFAAKRALTDP